MHEGVRRVFWFFGDAEGAGETSVKAKEVKGGLTLGVMHDTKVLLDAV